MAFFAIAFPPAAGGSFVVEKCHLNYWVFPRRVFSPYRCWDVGVLLKRPEGSTEPSFSLELVLPFGTSDKASSDLSQHVLTPATSELIFGEPVTVDKNVVNVASYGPAFTVGQVSGQQLVREDGDSGPGHSVWKVCNVEWPRDGRLVYLRMRFKVGFGSGPWSWEPSVFSRSAAFFDIRVCDVRGATNETLRALEARLAPIGVLNCFVVSPTTFYPLAMSPRPRYSRLLEPGAWSTYLGHSPGSKLVIYHWKAKPEEEGGVAVNVGRPFHAFLHLRRAPRNPIWDAMRVAAFVFIGFLALSFASSSEPDWLKQAVASVGGWSIGAQLLSGLGVLQLSAFLLNIHALGGIAHKVAAAYQARDWRRVFD